MQSRLNPYLSFKTNCREAMEFYKSVFGGTLTSSTFKDAGMSHAPGDDALIMHAMLEAENGISFMASDTPDGMPHTPGTTVSMALSGDNDAELTGYFEKLSVGGTVGMPLSPAPWGDKFGMFTDRFGIQWLVNIAGKQA